MSIEAQDKPKVQQIYVPAAKVEMFNRAKEIFNESLSAVIVNHLSELVEKREAELIGMSEHIIEIGTWPPNYYKYGQKNSRKRFFGKLIHKADKTLSAGTNAFAVDYAIYATKGNNFLLYYHIHYLGIGGNMEESTYSAADYKVVKFLFDEEKQAINEDILEVDWSNLTGIPSYYESGNSMPISFPKKMTVPLQFLEEALDILDKVPIEDLDI